MGEHAGKHPRHRYAYQVGATLLGLVLLATSVARAQNAGVESELRSLTERYLAAAQSEDMAAFEQTLDPEAPEYGARLRFQQDLAAKYDIRYDLLDFKLVASDDDFVYAHVSTTMRLWARQDAPAHPSDRLEVYHRSGGTWKIWSEVFLTTNEPWPGNAPTSQLDQLATHVLTARSLEALQDEDLSAYEQTLHPDGALAQGDLGDPEAVQARFDNYDLDYALLDFRAIASEGPFMVARVKQETRTHVGRAYPDNIICLPCSAGRELNGSCGISRFSA
ncbi:MAG: nuclear transport factor 2 family protein [Deinococcales bacterium]